MTSHRPFRTIILTLCCGLAALSFACSSDDDDSPLEIGALLPLSGALASYGETAQAALDLAVEEAGEEVSLVVEDTETDPETALAKLQALDERDIKVVIGPFASSEVQAVKDYADENGIILISPLSTARTLAIAGDNVLRFTPDDDREGAAMAALLWEQGIRQVIPISRDDAGNLGLQSAMKTTFEAMGGSVAPLITYGADETDFEDAVKSVGESIDAYEGGEPAGVYLTAFSEVTALFAEAAAGGLDETPWFGSDSVALSKDLIEDAVAAAFAADASYPNPILGLSDEDSGRWQPVSESIEAAIGRTPDAFALAAYDALIVAHEAMTNAGSDADADKLRDEIIEVASEHTGLTGSTALNEAGDRSLANYDFWAVCRDGAGFVWTRVATFSPAAEGPGQVTLPGC